MVLNNPFMDPLRPAVAILASNFVPTSLFLQVASNTLAKLLLGIMMRQPALAVMLATLWFFSFAGSGPGWPWPRMGVAQVGRGPGWPWPRMGVAQAGRGPGWPWPRMGVAQVGRG